MKAPLALETEYEDGIIAAARAAGWFAHAERPGRTKDGHRTAIKGKAGWPDLVLLSRRHRILVFAELKRPGNSPTPDQNEWLFALSLLDHIAEFRTIQTRLWYVPTQYEAILAWLADPVRNPVPE